MDELRQVTLILENWDKTVYKSVGEKPPKNKVYKSMNYFGLIYSDVLTH